MLLAGKCRLQVVEADVVGLSAEILRFAQDDKRF